MQLASYHDARPPLLELQELTDDFAAAEQDAPMRTSHSRKRAWLAELAGRAAPAA
jgi:hypothetical protein